VTISIFDVLATLPSGLPGSTLTNEELTKYLQAHYKTDGEKDRNARHALRDELYRDGGDGFMSGLIDKLFKDPTVRELRKSFIPFARFNNALKRLVNEMATTHSEPAKRMVGDDGENEKYQSALEAVLIDEQMLQVSRLLNLHRSLLVGFRVRKLGYETDAPREPVLDIVTPSNVRAITHPNDESRVVAWLVRVCHKTARSSGNEPKWTLWSDHESLQLRDDLSVIGDSHQIHDLGVCPWVPVTLGPPSAGFWPGSEGEDMVAGHLAIWLQNIFLMKESKSATKQTMIQGDGTAMSRGQAADSEVPNELADGQSATTVDMSMDLSMFRDTADHVLSHLAQNYGMSPALISHQGVQSAEARELMRMPLKEIRRQQQIPMRRFERQLAIVMSMVLAVDHPELAFGIDGWRIEFAEAETPLDPMSEMMLFEKRDSKGLDNAVLYLQRRHPGLTVEGALDMIANNVLVKTEIQRLMRPFMMISGALGASSPDGKTPEEINQGESAQGEPDLVAIAKEILNAN